MSEKERSLSPATSELTTGPEEDGASLMDSVGESRGQDMIDMNEEEDALRDLALSRHPPSRPIESSETGQGYIPPGATAPLAELWASEGQSQPILYPTLPKFGET